MTSELEVRDLRVVYGGNVAVDVEKLDLHVGEIVGLIGPNGAGKSSLVDAITGYVRPSSGQVLLNQDDVTSFRPDQLAHRGLARTFQNLELFEDLSIKEHFDLGDRSHRLFRRTRQVEADPEFIAMWRGLGVDPDGPDLVSDCSHGQRQMIALARAVKRNPKVLLLDEPANGLDHEQRTRFLAYCRRLRSTTALMVIDHDIEMLIGLCDRLYVMDAGLMIAEGPPEVVRQDEAVVAAYIGNPTSFDGDEHEGAGHAGA